MASARERAGVEAFVIDSLRRHGGRLTTLKKNAVRASFEYQPPFADAREFVVAFERKSLDTYPDAILAKPGSPFYHQLIDAARDRGGRSRVYTPIVEPAPTPPSERLIENPEVTWGTGATTNDPHLVFNFAISYQSVVTSDDLVAVGYDVVQQRFRSPDITDVLHGLWSETLAEAPGDWTEASVGDSATRVPDVVRVLDERIRKKVARARRNNERYVDREIQSVEEYYRQLIAEEKDALSRLASGAPEASEREARIRRYQLDWKRRVAEEQRHHQCRVHVRLVSVAEVFMPRTALTISGGPLTSPVEAAFNHFLGTLDGVSCDETGAERGPWFITDDGRWLSRSDDASDSEPDELGGDAAVDADNQED